MRKDFFVNSANVKGMLIYIIKDISEIIGNKRDDVASSLSTFSFSKCSLKMYTTIPLQLIPNRAKDIAIKAK